jgi:AcrR family transcriptional regulator
LVVSHIAVKASGYRGNVANQSMRKLPAQRRSRAKVQHILEVAERLLVEVGYDATVETPQLLLEAADVSRGAFYAYFTNPENVMDQLALGYMSEGRDMADQLARNTYGSVREVAEAYAETYRGHYERPQVRELWLQGHLSPTAVDADKDTNRYIAGRLLENLQKLDLNSPDLRLRHCEIAIEMLDYLLRFALRSDPAGDPVLVEEVNVALTAYLTQYVRG